MLREVSARERQARWTMCKASNWFAVVVSVLLFSLLVTSAALAAPPDKTGTGWPQIKFQKYKLANGLEVILSEDHRLPLVAVNLWYHVGPMEEKAGRTRSEERRVGKECR